MDTTNDDAEVQRIKHQMDEALALEHEQGELNWKSLLYDKSPIRRTRRLVLCFMIYFLQMFTGINVIAFYGKNERESYCYFTGTNFLRSDHRSPD
jgi:hypothetical protein